MKPLTVLIRLYENDAWSFGMQATSAAHAWQGMMMARARGFQTKVVHHAPRLRDFAQLPEALTE